MSWPAPIEALSQGVLGASSLALGGILGLFWHPSRRVSAAIMAFGSGALIAAIAFEVAVVVYDNSGFWTLFVGFMVGGGLFTLITGYIDQQGGFVRHPSSQRRYLFHQRQEEASEVLDRLAQIEVMRNLSPAEVQAVLPLLEFRAVQPETVICHEGEPGDALYFLAEGEAEVRKGETPIATLGAGEIFGEMSMLTGEPRSATVIARSPMHLYRLDRSHFNRLLTQSPQLASALSRVLARRLQATSASTQSLHQWRQQVLNSVELDLPFPQEQMLMEKLTRHSSAPLAILVGTLIDNIPESAVIGMTVGQSHVGGSFLLAVFLSNFRRLCLAQWGCGKLELRPATS